MVGDVGNVLFGEATGGRFEGLKGIAEHVVEEKGDAAELELGEVPVDCRAIAMSGGVRRG